MTTTEQRVAPEGAGQIIDSVRHAEESALEAVRKFVDTVDGVFPDVGPDGPRHKIIDAAFKMTERLLDASNELALRLVKVTGDVLATPASPPKSSK